MSSGKDSLIQVKGNQPRFFRAITEVVQRQPALSTVSSDERSRGRQERRTVEVFQAPSHLMEDWTGLQRVIHVDRVISRPRKTSETHSYSISSVCSDAAEVFAKGVRGHWSIENRLH